MSPNPDFPAIFPTTPEQPWSIDSLRQAAAQLSAYSSVSALPPELRTQYQNYLGEGTRHHLGGDWIELNEAEHGLVGRGILIDDTNGIVAPDSLLQVAWENDPDTTAALWRFALTQKVDEETSIS